MARNVWLIESRVPVPETYLPVGVGPQTYLQGVQGSSPRDIFTGRGESPQTYLRVGVRVPRHIYLSGWESPDIFTGRGESPQTYLIKIRGLNSGYIGSKTRKWILIWLKTEAGYDCWMNEAWETRTLYKMRRAWLHRDCIRGHTLVTTNLTCMTFVWLTAAC